MNGICQLASFEHSKLGKLSIGSNIGIIHKLSRLTDLQKNSSKLLKFWPSFLDVLLDVLSCEEYQINKNKYNQEIALLEGDLFSILDD